MILNPLTIRYSLDTPTLYGITCTGAMPSHYALARGLAQHVRVGPHVLPTLHTAARKVETRLGLTAELSVFVYASPEINAYVCPNATEQRILVFVSSTLLTSLSP